MVLLLWLGHVVAGIVGADHVVTSGMVLATLNQVPLDPLHGDLMGRVVWTGCGAFRSHAQNSLGVTCRRAHSNQTVGSGRAQI